MWALDSAALALASHIGLALDSSGSTDAATPAPRALVLDITSALSASELSVQDELGASQQQQHALKVLASFIPTQLRSPVAAQLVGDSAPAASSSSAANELLSAISVLALSKPLTLPAFCAFRPLALDLGSRWLEALGFDEQSASFKSLQQVAIEHMDVCAALVALIPHAPELHMYVLAVNLRRSSGRALTHARTVCSDVCSSCTQPTPSRSQSQPSKATLPSSNLS